MSQKPKWDKKLTKQTKVEAAAKMLSLSKLNKTKKHLTAFNSSLTINNSQHCPQTHPRSQRVNKRLLLLNLVYRYLPSLGRRSPKRKEMVRPMSRRTRQSSLTLVLK
jgi:hypothetical protein